ncbi:MAG: hypothetical protein ACTSQY_00980 [Candidatus Odinarchaeia archaeon]
MAYIDSTIIRTLTDITSDQLSDTDITALIAALTPLFNDAVLTTIEDELIAYIDDERENTIDGSNTTFYVRRPCIGDRDNDGDVDTSDLLVYSLDSDGTRTILTVSSIDDDELGKFTLNSAPTTDVTVYVSYRSCPVPFDNAQFQNCFALMAIAYAYLKITPLDVKKVGDLMLTNSSFEKYNMMYQNELAKLIIKPKSRFVHTKSDADAKSKWDEYGKLR